MAGRATSLSVLWQALRTSAWTPGGDHAQRPARGADPGALAPGPVRRDPEPYRALLAEHLATVPVQGPAARQDRG